jgi:hypothetical protein
VTLADVFLRSFVLEPQPSVLTLGLDYDNNHVIESTRQKALNKSILK